MDSAQGESNVGASPIPPIFSYAQAAKGRAISTATSVIQSSQTPSGVSTPAKDTKSAVNTPSGSVNGAQGSETGERSVNGSHDPLTGSDNLGVTFGSEMKPEAKQNSSINASSLPTSPSYGTASTSTLPKEEDLTLATAAPSHSQNLNTTDKPTENTEGRRAKRGKKQKNAEKEAEKEKEEVKQEILVPAVAPAVNIWQQRREEQAAKAKASPVVVQSSQAFSEVSILNDSAMQAGKPADTKRRGKPSGGEEADKTLVAAQNGGPRETSSSKGQKKGSEGVSRAKEDLSAKRAGPRGSRVSEKEEKASANQIPPPVEDAISWPTPETALEEERRKAQEKDKLEKEEKEDTISNRPRPKEKWVPVPYIPTVTFNTPLPPRGGRGRGGARGGRPEAGGRPSNAGNGAHAGDKTQTSSATTANSSGENEKRPPRANSLPPTNSKRQQSDQSGSRDRKFSAAQTAEKSKAGPMKNESAHIAETSRISTTAKTEQPPETHRDQDLLQGDNFGGFKSDQGQINFNENQPNPRSADRRSESNLRGSEQFKEGTNFSKESSQARDRAEGRSDRGRGGFRGRGAHSNFPNGQLPQHVFTNGHGPQAPSGYPTRQSSGPYSPPLQQPPFSNQFGPPPSRGGRGSARSQSIPNNAMYGRFPPNGGSQHIAPLQTSNPMFDYPPMQTLSAVPYNPYMDQYSVLAMVSMQLEYYFSIDNLCKDVFLRKHMDSQGFVFLTFIAGFKRIQALTQDFELLRYASQESESIDIIRGEDGVDRLRRKEGWEKWVLAKEERDESVRNDGPVSYFRQGPPQRAQHMTPMIMQGHHAISLPAFSPNGTESSFRPYGNGASMTPALNGNGTSYHPETPLSAAVPDFSPGLLPLNSMPDPLESETTFTDEEVANLTLVFAPQRGNDESKPKMPFHNPSRTFSNGSIDGRSIAEEIHDELRQGRTLTNGSRGPDT
jgi:la-related protein 1